MSEKSDNTDDLVLIPPDFFTLDDPFFEEDRYFEVVDSLITQVTNLENRINSIENQSDLSSLVSSGSIFMNSVRRHRSFDDVTQSQIRDGFESTQSTPQKPQTRRVASSTNIRRNLNPDSKIWALKEIDQYINNFEQGLQPLGDLKISESNFKSNCDVRNGGINCDSNQILDRKNDNVDFNEDVNCGGINGRDTKIGDFKNGEFKNEDFKNEDFKNGDFKNEDLKNVEFKNDDFKCKSNGDRSKDYFRNSLNVNDLTFMLNKIERQQKEFDLLLKNDDFDDLDTSSSSEDYSQVTTIANRLAAGSDFIASDSKKEVTNKPRKNPQRFDRKTDQKPIQSQIERNRISQNQIHHNQISHNQVAHNQLGQNQVSHNQVSQNQVGQNQVSYKQIGHNQIDHNQVGYNQVNHNQVGYNQINHNQVVHKKVSHNKVGHHVGHYNQIDHKGGYNQSDVNQVGFNQFGVKQSGLNQDDLIGLNQNSLNQKALNQNPLVQKPLTQKTLTQNNWNRDHKNQIGQMSHTKSSKQLGRSQSGHHVADQKSKNHVKFDQIDGYASFTGHKRSVKSLYPDHLLDTDTSTATRGESERTDMSHFTYLTDNQFDKYLSNMAGDRFYDSSADYEMDYVSRLDEEIARRQHYEQIIQHLQKQTINLQDQLAAAIRVDEAKDDAILRFHKAWEQVAQRLQTLVNERDVLEAEIKELEEQNARNLTQTAEKVSRAESELKKSEMISKANQEKCREMEKLIIDLTNEIQRLNNKIGGLEKELKNEDGFKKELKRDLENKNGLLNGVNEELGKLRNELEMEKKKVGEFELKSGKLMDEFNSEKKMLEKNNRDKDDLIRSLENQNQKLLIDIDVCKNNENDLQVKLTKALESNDKEKKDLKSFYQEQVERVVKEKLLDFQVQLERARGELEGDLKKREVIVAKTAAAHIQQIADKHSLEIRLLEEKHLEEVRLYQVQITQAQQLIDNLQHKLQHQQVKKQHMAKQLHKLMEAQWLEALKIINNGRSPVSMMDRDDLREQLIILKSKSYNNMEEVLEELEDDEQQKINQEIFNDDGKQTKDRFRNHDVEDVAYNETPLTSRQKKGEMDDIQKYIHMLMRNKQSDPTGDHNYQQYYQNHIQTQNLSNQNQSKNQSNQNSSNQYNQSQLNQNHFNQNQTNYPNHHQNQSRSGNQVDYLSWQHQQLQQQQQRLQQQQDDVRAKMKLVERKIKPPWK